MRLRAWGLAAALSAGFASSALADDRPPTTLAAKLFGPSKPKASAARKPPTIVAPLSSDVVSAALDAEQKAWERRVAVCDRLRIIADQTKDETLMRQADDLEQEATKLYKARVAALGIKVKPEASEPAASSESMKVAAKKLTAPSAPTIDPAVRTAEARTPEDVIREVKP